MKLPARRPKAKTKAKSAQLKEFGANREQRPMMAELYRQAAARLRKQPKQPTLSAADAELALDPRRQLHELQVHQIELEMQNAEIQESRDHMEVLLEKYTDLYDFAPVGYFSLNESAVIVEANLTSAVMLGVERSSLVNQRLLVFISPPSRPAFLAFLKRVFAGPKNQTCETQLLRVGGGMLGASFRAASAISLDQEQKWCRVAFVDISDRLAAETALRVSEKRYRTLFDLFPVAVYACDAAGVVQDYNRRAVELWGRKLVAGNVSERFCGSFKLFRPDGSLMRHEECPMVEVVHGTKTEVQDAEVVIQRPDGSRITVVVNIRALLDEHGKITGAINCFYDITERKLAEAAQLRLEVLAASNRKLEQEIVQRRAAEAALEQTRLHQQELLEQSSQMQEHLRSLSRQVIQAQEEERKRISRELHDVIGQTLTGINIRLASLKKAAGVNTKDFDRDIARTQQLVQKSVDIVHQFARELRPAVLDDLGLIPALHSFMKHFSERTGIHTHLTAFAGVEEIEIDRRTVLFRVAQEALTNVARHAKASRADVSIQKLVGCVCVKIKDNGKSFDVERALRVTNGKRLGLLGMRERLEMVGGKFEIESAPGKGTTVTAQIPSGKSLAGGGGAIDRGH